MAMVIGYAISHFRNAPISQSANAELSSKLVHSSMYTYSTCRKSSSLWVFIIKEERQLSVCE